MGGDAVFLYEGVGDEASSSARIDESRGRDWFMSS